MVIALITDFGLKDPYVGVVKGVIYSHGFTGTIVDVCHSCVPYSIEHAQFIVATSYKYFPENTIFVVVVDPEVGTSRKILLISDGSYYFLMPDNGIAGCLNQSIITVYEIDTKEFTNASTTFHGRDIFAIVAARLATKGISGVACKEYVRYIIKPFPFYDIKKGSIVTKVAHIDQFGNCILSLPNKAIAQQLRSVCIGDTCYRLTQCKTYADLSYEDIGILQGSSGFVEICMFQKDCSNYLHVTIGDSIELLYE